MRLQSNQASCGFAAVANGLRALGVDVDETVVARWVDRVRRADNPGADGLSEMGLIRAVTEGSPKRLRLRVRALHVADGEQATLALRGALEGGRVAVLGVDPEEDKDEPGTYAVSHWVTAIGRIGERFLVADAADPELVLSYSPPELAARWEIPGANPGYYLILIWRERNAQ